MVPTARINNLMESHYVVMSLAVLLVATAGVFLQIVGTSRDVTSHLLQRPETFFTPPHAVLYSGVGLLVIAAALGGIYCERITISVLSHMPQLSNYL